MKTIFLFAPAALLMLAATLGLIFFFAPILIAAIAATALTLARRLPNPVCA